MTDTIQLESFNQSLHGAKILCQGPFRKNEHPPIIEAIQNIREPFKKKILLTNTAFGLSKYLSIQYDTVFHVKDTADWTLILTYATYAPKPLLIISEDIGLPDGIWSKLTKMITFVNYSLHSVLNLRPYDAIFFPLIDDINILTPANIFDYTYKALQTVYRGSYSTKEHKEVLQELRIAKAGLMWSKYDDKNGALYWYDLVTNNGEKLSPVQLSELFSYLSTIFS